MGGRAGMTPQPIPESTPPALTSSLASILRVSIGSFCASYPSVWKSVG
ncbi:hypothetical protein E2C01_068763 [Portunus trituberculatus]|uniref:Uncharacterized protein n=1 Tax=Portunus trituberculatus TaxID=210409 RepID=A0A5B7HX28_PORTR|nr:hypothetical protein [Portunus trituberculatus]